MDFLEKSQQSHCERIQRHLALLTEKQKSLHIQPFHLNDNHETGRVKRYWR